MVRGGNVFCAKNSPSPVCPGGPVKQALVPRGLHGSLKSKEPPQGALAQKVFYFWFQHLGIFLCQYIAKKTM